MEFYCSLRKLLSAISSRSLELKIIKHDGKKSHVDKHKFRIIFTVNYVFVYKLANHSCNNFIDKYIRVLTISTATDKQLEQL